MREKQSVMRELKQLPTFNMSPDFLMETRGLLH